MTCEQYHDVLVAGIRSELSPLASQRLQSHLGHCKTCRAAHEVLQTGLAAARAYEPSVTPELAECLRVRLAPHLEVERHSRQRRAWFLVPAFAALAVLVALMVRGFPLGSTAGAPNAPALVQLAPTPFVRVVADGNWDGRVSGGPVALAYDMTRGTAAFSFHGGDGRSLEVRTPLGAVRAVGTKFSVGMTGVGQMSVVVNEGVVAISSLVGERTAVAGTAWLVDRRGTVVSVQASDSEQRYFRHAFMLAPWPPLTGQVGSTAGGHDFSADQTNEQPRTLAPRTPRPTPPATDRVGAAHSRETEIAQLLDRAESLVKSGATGEALAIYTECMEIPQLSRAYSDLCAYERARIIGFVLGAGAQARVMFHRLAVAGAGETRWQAMLALCELEREQAPCAAVQCAAEIADNAALDAMLRREAQRLAQRWHQDGRCEEQR